MDTNAFAHYSVHHCSTDLPGTRPLAESDPGLPEMSGCAFRHPAGTQTRVQIWDPDGFPHLQPGRHPDCNSPMPEERFGASASAAV